MTELPNGPSAAGVEPDLSLRAILDHTTAVIYVKDARGCYLFVNRRFERLFGVTADQVRGKTDHDLFPKETADRFRANDRKVLEAQAPLELEEVAPHDDGPHTYISLKFPLHDSAGQPYAVCGISCDITERKRAEEAQRESIRTLEATEGVEGQRARRLKALVRAGVALTSELALDEVLQTFVDTAREVLDARYAALGVLDPSGSGLAQLIVSGLSKEEVAQVGEFPRGRGVLGVVINQAKSLRLKDVTRDPRSYGFPPRHPRMKSFLGVPVRVRGRVFGNLYVTEKTQAEEFTAEDQEIAELLAAQAAVAIENARLYQERNIFTAIINHEIKNAVAGVLGWSDRLRRLSQEADEGVAEAARFTREAAANLHKLVTDLLELSRIESGRVELNLGHTDLRAMIREVVGISRPAAENRQVTLQVEGAEGGEGGATIVTDAQRTRQIVHNLLSNAIKFTGPGSCVTIRVRATHAGGYAIDVADQGPGVPASKREAIFAAYQQADQAHRALGTGLGLTVSRALARILGGDLTVTDAADGGALFTLHLPGREP